MPTGYLVSLGDTSLDVNDTINATPVTFTTFSTIGAGGWRWTGVWSGNGNSYSNISDTGVFYEGTDGNVYFIPDTWTTLSGTAVVTSAPSYTAPNYVNGTGLADVIDTSYTDSDGDQVDGGDGTGAAGNEDTISAGDGNDTVDAGAEDDIVYGGGGGDSIDGGTGADTLYGDTDDISPGGVDGSDTISGGAGDDVIYGEGGGDSLFGDAGSDNITGGAGDDTISGGADDDTLTGGIGDDSIDGDAGNDFIGGEPTDDTTILDWGDVDANGTFTLTGSVAGEELGVTVTTIANATGQTANAQSSGSPSAEGLWVSGLTSAVTSTLVFDEPVNSANFEIYDIDQNTGSWDDMLTIIATDAEGNEATVTFSDLDGLHSVDGDTLNADGNASTGVETTGADDSVTVSIAGPFVQIVFTFDNGESASNSGLFGVGNMTLDFTANADDDPGNDTMNGGTGEDTIYAGSGDDSLSGGIGDDELHGQEGDDVFNVAEGDSAYGGDGDDYFSLVELNETPGVAGNGIYIEGGEGDETVGDTLNLGKLGYRGEINYTNTDDANGGLSGTLVLHDGTLLTFENIEKIICFTPGTMIATPKGPRAVETLKPGDLVTTRDNGAQAIRWMGQRTLPCTPGTAPVRFEMGSLEGLTAPLLVSPQHKMLIDHCAAELLFGEQEVFCKAKHMVGANIGHQAQKMVTYVHMMLDAHEVVFANGVASESFHAGPEGIPALSDASKADLFANFPELENDPYAHGPAAYPCLKAHETALLMQDIEAAAPLQDIALAA